jgi:hypothetical protein
MLSRTIWIYTGLYMFTIDVIFNQVKLLMFCSVQTTNLAFVGKMRDVQ